MPACNHIKSDGRPCNAPALRKHSYCFFHQQQLNRRRRDYVDRLPILEDRAAVQVAIMQVLDRLYNKTIDYKAAALMLEKNIHRLPVVKDGRLVGTVGRPDMCQAVVGTL